MAEKKIKMLGSQAVSSEHGTSVSKTLISKGDYTINSEDGGADAAGWYIFVSVEAGNPRASVEARLYNAANELVERAHKRVGSSDPGMLSIHASNGQDVSVSATNTNGHLFWVVAPDAFATGRMEIDIHGKLTTSSVNVYAPHDIAGPSAFLEKTSGSGVYTLSIPFTVEAVV